MLCRFQSPSLRASVSRSNCIVAKQPRALKPISRAATAAATEGKDKEVVEKQEFEHDVPDPNVSMKQVATFLTTLVDETEFVELSLQVGSFELNVKRSTSGVAAATPAPAAPAYPVAVESAPVVDVAPPAASAPAMDESMVLVSSMKVGIFRRGKYAGGKRIGSANLVNEGDKVKKGAALGYVEQLGTHFAVEAPQAGEVAKFLLEDGAPVEFNQTIVNLAPFFGGHIIGDNKHA